MPKRRNIKKFGRQATLSNLTVGLLGFAAFGFMFVDWPIRGTRFWIATVVFAGACVSIWLMDLYRFRTFHCPQCRERLPHPDFDSLDVGDAICFVCKRCDIEWDSGLTESDPP